MEGRELRLRLLTIEPGGYIGIHSHEDRPAVVYFLQGTDTVTFGDGTVKTFKPGDTGSADHATTHWHRNDGKEPVVFIAVDILHKRSDRTGDNTLERRGRRALAPSAHPPLVGHARPAQRKLGQSHRVIHLASQLDQWLGSIGLAKYAPLFAENEVDSTFCRI